MRLVVGVQSCVGWGDVGCCLLGSQRLPTSLSSSYCRFPHKKLPDRQKSIWSFGVGSAVLHDVGVELSRCCARVTASGVGFFTAGVLCLLCPSVLFPRAVLTGGESAGVRLPLKHEQVPSFASHIVSWCQECTSHVLSCNNPVAQVWSMAARI